MKPVVVATTVYPGVESFLASWWRSVRDQSDREFSLLIGLDGLSPAQAMDAMGGDPDATWVPAAPGASIAQVRQQAWEALEPDVRAVVLVDADDVLEPTRVAAARAALARADLNACALTLVDADGVSLGRTFPRPPADDPAGVLPRHNVFGLSNSAYRAETLRAALPLPAASVAVDWYLATRTWLQGARISFDATPHMRYRQHDRNLTQIDGPFTPARVLADTRLVRRHLALVLDDVRPADRPDRLARVRSLSEDVELFYHEVASDPGELTLYVDKLDQLPTPAVWWWCVACPALAHLWRR